MALLRAASRPASKAAENDSTPGSGPAPVRTHFGHIGSETLSKRDKVRSLAAAQKYVLCSGFGGLRCSRLDAQTPQITLVKRVVGSNPTEGLGEVPANQPFFSAADRTLSFKRGSHSPYRSDP